MVGARKTNRAQQYFPPGSHRVSGRLQCSPTTSGLVPAAEARAPSLLTAGTTPVGTAVTAGPASMATEYSAPQRVRLCFGNQHVISDMDVGGETVHTLIPL